MYELVYDRFHVKQEKAFKIMVGAEGFELSTSSSQSCVHRFVFNDLGVRPRRKQVRGVNGLGLDGTTFGLFNPSINFHAIYARDIDDLSHC